MRRMALIFTGLGLASGLLGGCSLIGGIITEETPAEPTPVTTLPGSPIIIPVITPAPIVVTTTTTLPAGPPPSPGPQPTPTPSQPPPTSNGCGLPSQSPAVSCAMGTPRFASDIEWAIDEVIRTKPQIFDPNDLRGAKSPRVLNEPAYTGGLVSVLAQRGYCAVWDGEEIGIKNSQSFNEQYDILTWNGYVRRGPGAYRSTCTPAWF